MKLAITIILTSVLLFSCSTESKKNTQENSRIELVPEPDKHLRLEYEKNKEFLEMTNDSLWLHLVFKKGGCLTGGQHVYEGKFGSEGCVMTNSKEWKIFFKRDKNEITDFLISKISGDTTKTYIHTCPFFTAMGGEVAIYGLQKIYGLNWFEFDEFKEFKNRQSESSLENHQAWLQGILKNDTNRSKLINCWKKKACR